MSDTENEMPDEAEITIPSQSTLKTVSALLTLLVVTGLGFVVWLQWSREWVYDAALFWFHRLRDQGPSPVTMAELGQMGDIFGGINPAFAALAFLGAACGAFFQYQAYRLQKNEAMQAARALIRAERRVKTELKKADERRAEDLEKRDQDRAQRQKEREQQVIQESIRLRKESAQYQAQIKAAQKERFDALFFRMLS